MTSEPLFPQNIVPSPDELPPGFLPFIDKLVQTHGPSWELLLQRRAKARDAATKGFLPTYSAHSVRPSPANRITLPDWCQSQVVQLTFPASSAKMGVGGWNSEPSGVMFDFEDSNMNTWEALSRGVANARAAMYGELTYVDKNGATVAMKKGTGTVLTTRVRGLHMAQRIDGRLGLIPAPLFDLGLLLYGLDWPRLAHPPVIYIPKMESHADARWFRAVLRDVAKACGQAPDAIKCMVLIERHAMAYDMDEMIFALRDHILAINLGKWDYVADFGRYTAHDPSMLLPDRTSIPYDTPLLQHLGMLAVNTGHDWGILVIYGMTALFPNKEDPALDALAMKLLHDDSVNGVRLLFDGKWSGHPRQTQMVKDIFAFVNQLDRRWPNLDPRIELRPPMVGAGTVTLAGTRAAIRASIEYREGVLRNDAAAMVRGYMLDLAMDLIDRVIIDQRILHRVEVDDGRGGTFTHALKTVAMLYGDVLAELVAEAGEDAGRADRYRRAADISFEMVRRREFEPT